MNMIAAWSVCAILFASAMAVPLRDDPALEKVKEVIAEVNNYISAHNLTELRIPNIDLPFSPAKIRNGGLGDFSTIELLNGSSVSERTLKDNTTVYKFDIKLGLESLRFHYEFDVNTIIFKRSGNFSLSVKDNVAEVTGFAVVNSARNNSCRAVLLSAKVLRLEDNQIDVEPNDYPEIFVVSEYLLNAVSPYLLPFTNQELRETIGLRKVQRKFSEFACERIANL